MRDANGGIVKDGRIFDQEIREQHGRKKVGGKTNRDKGHEE